MAAKTVKVVDGAGNPILPQEEVTASKERPACALTPGCIKYAGHEKGKHAGEVECQTFEQAYSNDGEAPAAASPKARKKPVRSPLPTDPALWRLKHVTRSVDAIERIWKRIPPTKRALAREDVAAIIGQRDIEETAVKS